MMKSQSRISYPWRYGAKGLWIRGLGGFSLTPNPITPNPLYLLLLVALCVTRITSPAHAHDRSTSYSSWELRGRDARVVARLTELDLSRFPWALEGRGNYDELTGHYVSTHLRLFAADAPCPTRDPPRRLAAPPGRVVFEWRVQCPPEGRLEVRTSLLLEVAAAHLHFARVGRDGAPTQERVLSEAEAAWPLDRASDGAQRDLSGTSLSGYIALGIEHILSGYDHLAFVLALLLIGGSLGEVARVVTGFTIAHSITLGLTVLGYVQPDNAPVEALIGLSIFLVAAENSWLVSQQHRLLPLGIAAALAGLALGGIYGYGKVPALTCAGLALFTACYFELLRRLAGSASVRWAVAFLFGLVHGFGFATVLAEAGLPTDRLATALLGFNIGVELGQLGVVAVIWPILHALLRADNRAIGRSVVEVGSAAVAGLGLFWFVSRTFG